MDRMIETALNRITCAILALYVISAAFACRNEKVQKTGEREKYIKELKEASLKILPESFHNIWIGIHERDFVKARSSAKFQPAKSDPDERKWYREVDKTGVNVWYGVDRESSRLVVIQYANQLPSWRVFSEHAALLMEKYGTDYELYVCPAGDPRFKMTRLLWPRQPISIMEAILEAKESISVTMVVSTLKDARRAIERQKCPKVDKEAALETWIQENLSKEKKNRTKHPEEPPVH